MIDRNKTLLVLAAHAEKYPLIQPCDAVKLLYQNTFGGGHLIASAQESLLRLRAEYASIRPDPSVPLLEDIGNGFVRVQLRAVTEDTYPLERLNADFVRSAAMYRGDRDAFLEKLTLLRERWNTLPFAFSHEELEHYLTAYEQDGYPAVSHSLAYRGAYQPAYRVLHV